MTRHDPTTARSRAVVLVSGVLSHSPFTTPDAACTTGFAAGNSDTYLREFLLDAGFAVYTAPQRVGDGAVVESDDTFVGPFGSCPPPLPAEMTVDTTAPVSQSGLRLHAFVTHLHDAYGITDIDLVGHSMGGPLSRALIGEIDRAGGPVKVHSLTTVGSPWETPMVAKPTVADDPHSACDGLEVCELFVDEIENARPAIEPLIAELSTGYEAWAESLAGTLDDIPVTLIAGSYFTKDDGDPAIWPNDGAIQLVAATAANVSDRILPDRTVHVLPLTHSPFVSGSAGLTPETSIIWNPEVGRIIVEFLHSVA